MYTYIDLCFVCGKCEGCIRIYIYIDIYIYKCIYTYLYICIYIHTYIHRFVLHVWSVQLVAFVCCLWYHNILYCVLSQCRVCI